MDNPRVFDVGAADFKQRVLEASKEAPVVVDFWAGWCAPCRMLGPVLEREVSSATGAVALAKLDVDANPELASTFEIRGIPAVKAFKDGQVVAEFEGARDAGFVRRWLAELEPSEAELELEGAATAAALRPLISDARVGPRARLKLAALLLKQGNASEATDVLEGIAWGVEEAESARLLATRAAFAADAERAGGEAAARAALDKSAGDLDARWHLAGALAAREQWNAALAELLELVKRGRKYRDDGARKMMLVLFEELGHGHPLTRDFRRQLMLAI